MRTYPAGHFARDRARQGQQALATIRDVEREDGNRFAEAAVSHGWQKCHPTGSIDSVMLNGDGISIYFFNGIAAGVHDATLESFEVPGTFDLGAIMAAPRTAFSGTVRHSDSVLSDTIRQRQRAIRGY